MAAEAQGHDDVAHIHHDQEQLQQQQPESSSSSSTVDGDGSVMRDVVLWRRNKVVTNAAILLVSTASWVLLQLYRISALTLLSWSAILLLSLLFLWGTVLRLLRKEGPVVRGMEMISEQQMLEGAHTCKAACEAALKWMLHLTIEGDWLHFTSTVVALLLLSYVATFFELPTLIYIGIIMGMSVPVVYVKYGDRMKRWWEMMKQKGSRLYAKLIHNVKEKVSGKKPGDQVGKLDKKTE